MTSMFAENLIAAFRLDSKFVRPVQLFLSFLVYTRKWPRLRNEEDLVFPLVGATRLGFSPARAVLPAVFQSLQMKLPSDLDGQGTHMLMRAVSTGSQFAGAQLKRISNNKYRRAMTNFHEDGGYNCLYSPMSKLLSTEATSADLSDHALQLDTKGNRLIHLISGYGSSRALRRLLALRDVDINAQNFNSETGLYLACARGAWHMAKILLAHGADPTISNGKPGITCSHWLIAFHDDDVYQATKSLKQHGADLNALTLEDLPTMHYPFILPRGSPLHWAVTASREWIIECLLNNAASPTIRNGSDPYKWDQNFRVLNRFGDPDSQLFSIPTHSPMGISPIDLAVSLRDPFILRYLQRRGDINVAKEVDEEGCSPFHRLDSGHLCHTFSDMEYRRQLFMGSPKYRSKYLSETILALKHLGGDINQVTTGRPAPFRNWTPLMLAMQANELETVKALIENGADVNSCNSMGETVLFRYPADPGGGISQQGNYVKSVRFILAAGADVTHTCNEGKTAICSIAIFNGEQGVKLLAEHGANLSERDPETKMTILAILAREETLSNTPKDHAIASMLHEYVFPMTDEKKRQEILEEADKQGGSLLSYMAYAGYENSVKALLCSGVRTNQVYRNWRTMPDAALGEVNRIRSAKPGTNMTPLDLAIKRRDSWSKKLAGEDSATTEKHGKTIFLGGYKRREGEACLHRLERIIAEIREHGGLSASTFLNEKLPEEASVSDK